MVSVLKILRSLSGRSIARPQAVGCITSHFERHLSDTPNPDAGSKQVVKQGPENVQQVRVRRARAADVPRVVRFVREHARSAWPGLAPPPRDSHLLLSDYVARALAQGHSMLAEQQEARCGWSRIRGLALNTVVCPWDPAMLDRWARCVRCPRSRRLISFTAHCLRAPALHDKYRVHNILQVTLIVPHDTPKTSEIINLLAKNSIQRGREEGLPLIRFDVSDGDIAKTLEQLELKKEWQMSYEILPDNIVDKNLKDMAKETAESQANKAEETKPSKTDSIPSHFVAPGGGMANDAVIESKLRFRDVERIKSSGEVPPPHRKPQPRTP